MAEYEELKRLFHKDMVNIYFRAKRECHYNAERFFQMVDQRGGLETAKDLISRDEVSEGFTNLYLLGRLDLAMENLVVNPTYSELFTDEEIAKCRERLETAKENMVK